MKTKKRKTIASKILALCLAVVMLMGMSVTAFAQVTVGENGEITTTGMITVTGQASDEGATVHAYKVIDIVFDGTQPVEPVYRWTDTMAAWFESGGTQYEAYIGEENAVTGDYKKATAADLNNFYQAVSSDALGTSVATGTINNGSATLTVPAGVYVIKTAGAEGSVYQPIVVVVDIVNNGNDWNVVENTPVTLKGSEPGIEKEITDDDNTVQIGDTVNYQLTVDIPSYPENATCTSFKIGDTLSSGLTLNDEIVIKIGTDAETAEVLPNRYYELTKNGNEFVYDLTKNYDTLKETYPNATKIFVTYSATVNENAFEEITESNDGTNLSNKAFIGYTNNPYDEDGYTEKPDIEKVYTYGIKLKKTDKDGQNPLSGASFELRTDKNGDPVSFVKVNDGVYRLAKAGEEDAVTKLTVSSNGTLELRGLDLGTYYLKEVEAPEEYVLPDNATITVVLGENKPVDGILDVGENGTLTKAEFEGDASISGISDVVAGASNIISFDVKNVSYTDTDFDLPATGGMGTMIFTVAGILLMGGAVALVVVAMKKKKSN